MDDDLEKL